MDSQNDTRATPSRGRHIYVGAATFARLQMLNPNSLSHSNIVDSLLGVLHAKASASPRTSFCSNDGTVIDLQQRQLAELQRENAMLKAKLRAVASVAG